MNKCLNIFLITVFCLNSFGFIFFYLNSLEENKREMLQKISRYIPDNQLTIIKLSEKSYEALNDKNEFEYNNSMYDVVRIERNGSLVKLFCLNDKNEESLIKNFKKYYDGDHKRTGPANPRVSIITFSYIAILNNTFNFQKLNSRFGQLSLDFKMYSSVISDISSPPPRFI